MIKIPHFLLILMMAVVRSYLVFTDEYRSDFHSYTDNANSIPFTDISECYDRCLDTSGAHYFTISFGLCYTATQLGSPSSPMT